MLSVMIIGVAGSCWYLWGLSIGRANSNAQRLEDEELARFEKGNYFGPAPDAVATVNRLLALPPIGVEQDWEIQMVDPSKVDAMFQLLADGSLCLEERSAVGLLLTHTVDELDDDDEDTSELVPRLRSALASDEEVLRRMRFYWSHLQASEAIQAALA